MKSHQSHINIKIKELQLKINEKISRLYTLLFRDYQSQSQLTLCTLMKMIKESLKEYVCIYNDDTYLYVIKELITIRKLYIEIDFFEINKTNFYSIFDIDVQIFEINDLFITSKIIQIASKLFPVNIYKLTEKMKNGVLQYQYRVFYYILDKFNTFNPNNSNRVLDVISEFQQILLMNQKLVYVFKNISRRYKENNIEFESEFYHDMYHYNYEDNINLLQKIISFLRGEIDLDELNDSTMFISSDTSNDSNELNKCTMSAINELNELSNNSNELNNSMVSIANEITNDSNELNDCLISVACEMNELGNLNISDDSLNDHLILELKEEIEINIEKFFYLKKDYDEKAKYAFECAKKCKNQLNEFEFRKFIKKKFYYEGQVKRFDEIILHLEKKLQSLMK